MVIPHPTSLISARTPLDVYLRYCDEVSALRRTGGTHFNGCRDRAKRMSADFLQLGYEAVILVANAGGFPFIHESNAYISYHDILLSDGLVYDPNYTQRSPLPFEEYPLRVYTSPDEVYLWRKNEPSKPVWQYSRRTA